MSEPSLYRSAMLKSAKLLRQDRFDEALTVLNGAIAVAIEKDERCWTCSFCNHAAVVATFKGNRSLAKQYYEKALSVNPDNARALYGVATISKEQGQIDLAEEYALKAYRTIVESDDEILRAGLLDLITAHWPEIVDQQ